MLLRIRATHATVAAVVAIAASVGLAPSAGADPPSPSSPDPNCTSTFPHRIDVGRLAAHLVACGSADRIEMQISNVSPYPMLLVPGGNTALTTPVGPPVSAFTTAVDQALTAYLTSAIAPVLKPFAVQLHPGTSVRASNPGGYSPYVWAEYSSRHAAASTLARTLSKSFETATLTKSQARAQMVAGCGKELAESAEAGKWLRGYDELLHYTVSFSIGCRGLVNEVADEWREPRPVDVAGQSSILTRMGRQTSTTILDDVLKVLRNMVTTLG